MSQKPKAIVLGGTIPHKFLVQNLKKRGYETILIDYYDAPPAAEVADRHIKASTLDLEAVLDIARNEEAALVIAGCVDQANLTACYVAEELGLPHPYPYQTAKRVTDKELMKQGLINAGVATADHKVVKLSEIDSFTCGTFPKVVKPCDCNGSKGVQKVNNSEDLYDALRVACQLSRTSKAIVEDFMEGEEISAYIYLGKGEVHLLHSKTKEKTFSQEKEGFISFMSLGPMKLSQEAESKLLDFANKIGEELNLTNTPLLVQAIVKENKVGIIEFAPRVGGGLAFREIEILTGFDFIDAVVSSYLREEVKIPEFDKSKMVISIMHLFGMHGQFDRVDGEEALLKDGIIEEIHIHKSRGMQMSSEDLSSRNRVLGVIVKGVDINAIKGKAGRIAKGLKIISMDNQDVFDRKLFNGLFPIS